MPAKTWIPFAALSAVLIAASPVACSTSGSSGSSSGASGPASRDCDPLSVDAAPITLGEIVGAGKAKDGTIYVLDRGPAGTSAGLRGFVSEGNVLRRHDVRGSGEGPDFVVATLADAAGDIQVRVEIANGTATRMGISRGAVDPKTKSFEIGSEGEELGLLSAADLSGFQLANIASIEVMYAATTADGHRFFAFEPTIDRRDDAVRVFYGMAERVVERRVLSIGRSSAVLMEIDVEGVRTKAVLTYCLSGGTFGAARLEPEDGPTIALTPVPGSPGGVTCPLGPESDAGNEGDAGAEAGAPVSPVDATTLTAGMRFVCF